MSSPIDVSGVLHAGRELDVSDRLTIPEFATYRFPEPVLVSLRIRRVGRGIEVRGTIDAAGENECARCLDLVRYPLRLEIDETLEPGEENDPLGESNVFAGDRLDLLDLVRQTIDSALPYTVLCREDCPGLCPACGSKNDGVHAHAH